MPADLALVVHRGRGRVGGVGDWVDVHRIVHHRLEGFDSARCKVYRLLDVLRLIDDALQLAQERRAGVQDCSQPGERVVGRQKPSEIVLCAAGDSVLNQGGGCTGCAGDAIVDLGRTRHRCGNHDHGSDTKGDEKQPKDALENLTGCPLALAASAASSAEARAAHEPAAEDPQYEEQDRQNHSEGLSGNKARVGDLAESISDLCRGVPVLTSDARFFDEPHDEVVLSSAAFQVLARCSDVKLFQVCVECTVLVDGGRRIVQHPIILGGLSGGHPQGCQDRQESEHGGPHRSFKHTTGSSVGSLVLLRQNGCSEK